MMPKLFPYPACLIVLFALLTQNAFTQNNYAPSKELIPLAKALDDGNDLAGTLLTFQSDIVSTHFDSELDMFFVHFRTSVLNDGKIRAFSLKTMKPIWDDDLEANAYYQFVEKELFISNGKKTRSINLETGKKNIKYKGIFVRFFNEQRIGIFYQGSAEHYYLTGIALDSGIELWKRELRFKSAAPVLMQIKPDEALFIAEGLHSINISTGKGWSVETRMEDEDFKPEAQVSFERKQVVVGAAGLAFGLLTGLFIIPVGSSSEYGTHGPIQLYSNLIVTDSSYIIASKNKLLNIRKTDGEIFWKAQLPKQITSKSEIVSANGKVYLINCGTAQDVEGVVYPYGKPYTSAYDGSTGDELFMNELESVESISCALATPAYFGYLKNNAIHLHDATTGDAAIERTTPKGALKSGFSGSLYQYKQETRSFALDTLQTVFTTEGGQVLRLSPQHELVEVKQDPYVRIWENDRVKVYTNLKNNQTLVKDGQTKAIYQLSEFAKYQEIGGYLFAHSGNTLRFCRL